jgi:hypothetical protein
MSNFLKVIISFFIVILISIIVYIFIFSNIFNIKFFNFLNTNLENKIQKSLNEISGKIENYIVNLEKNKIDPYIKSIDFSVYSEKNLGKKIDISSVVSKAKNLIVTSDGLDAIKFFDNKGKIIFSTVSDEKIQAGTLVNFISNDKIETRNDFFFFRDARPGFLFDQKNGYLILKKNITVDNNPVGIMLFYLKDNFLTDIIRNYNYIDFKKPYYVNSNIILLYKPDEVPEDYLFNFTLDKNKVRLITFKDKSGTEIQKAYMLFSTEMKEVDLITARFVDNQQFILDKRNQMILFYTFFFTLYLLVLAIVLFRKNEINKLKYK